MCRCTYQVTVTDAASQTQVFTVQIDDFVPTVSFTMNETVCNDGQSIPFANYSPLPSTGETGVFSGTGVNGNNFDVATAGNGSFDIVYTFTDAGGCSDTAQGHIVVNAKPNPTISGINATYCLSNLSVQPTLTPAGGIFSGSGVSGNTFDIMAAGIGTHTLKYVVTQNGCTDSATFVVTINGTTPPQFTLQDSICLNANPLTLSGTPSGGTFTLNSQTITQFNPSTYGIGYYGITYTVTDVNNPQCLAQTTDSIRVINGVNITTTTPTYFCFATPDQKINMNPSGGQFTGTLISTDSLMLAQLPQGVILLTTIM